MTESIEMKAVFNRYRSRYINRFLWILVFLFMFGKINAQHYTRDAGMRLGDFFSLTYRQYQHNDQALEGMLFFGRKGVSVFILKEFFQPVAFKSSDYLFFEYGFGAHAGFQNIDHYRVLNRTYVLEEKQFNPLLGVDGLIGLEYRFPDLPLVISIDFKPYFEYSVVQVFGIHLNSFGTSIKYKF